MNKRQLKKIITLYKEGVSAEVCIAAILDLLGKNASSLEKGTAIHEFYEKNIKLKIENYGKCYKVPAKEVNL